MPNACKRHDSMSAKIHNEFLVFKMWLVVILNTMFKIQTDDFLFMAINQKIG